MFSTALKIGDLDDFLELTQDCVKPLLSSGNTSIKPDLIKQSSYKKKRQEEYNNTNSRYNEAYISKDGSKYAATVNVVDCLTCSGCVTAAETILLQHHNTNEFLKNVKVKKLTIVSICNQSCAAFASLLNIHPVEAMMRLCGLFKYLGAKYVINSTLSEFVSLLEAKEEFIFRYKYKDNQNMPVIVSHCPGWVCYAEKTLDPSVIPMLSRVRSSQQIQGILVKYLTCFAHNSKVLLYKWKQIWSYSMKIKQIAEQFDFVEQHELYHVCIAPCYDKKLESVRSYLPTSTINSDILEIDTVLATVEIQDLIKSSGFNSLLDIPKRDLDNLWLDLDFIINMNSSVSQNNEISNLTIENSADLKCIQATYSDIINGKRNNVWLLPSYYNSGSGGYCEYIFRSSVMELFNVEIPKDTTLEYTNDNSGIIQICFKIKNEVELKFGIVNGFRAIQGIVKKLDIRRRKEDSTEVPQKSAKDTFHYLEIMACPSGCTSGGGQSLKLDYLSQNDSEGDKYKQRGQFLQSISALLHDTNSKDYDIRVVTPENLPIVLGLYKYLKHIDNSSAISEVQLPVLRSDFAPISGPQSSSLKW
ncbi:nuclear prelamin A recognition factor-like protein [Cryptosporidium andersoni]|uniref:Nuclear prelamin A recognition factor-like protein n=1 Tax=Cryptosporidium andersoni TaxID=117008 RepID=A0A1J4MRZ9_9CRYT|nr:nuclear prelamin A recognition factor-like protein [Cryptosporidium andersoni]